VVVAGGGSGFGEGVLPVESAGSSGGGGLAEAGEDDGCVGLGEEAGVGSGEGGWGDLPRGIEADEGGGCGVGWWGWEADLLQDGLEGGGVDLLGEGYEIGVAGVGESGLDVEGSVALGEPAAVSGSFAREVGEGGVGAGVGEGEEGFGEGAYGDGGVGVEGLLGEGLAGGDVED